jgi:hypothetical protein
MRNFTKLWQWMMILVLSSSVSAMQAQTYSESVFSKESAEKPEMKIQLEKGTLPDYLNWPSVAAIISEVSLKESLEGEPLQKIAEILKDAENANAVGSDQMEQLKEVISGQAVSYGIGPNGPEGEGTIKNPDGSITVTLGTDITYNGTTTPPTPYGTYWKNFRQQYLILAYELIQLGIGAGPITELGFEVFALNNCVSMPNYTIQMKHTIESQLTTTFDNGTYQTVWTNPNFLPVVGWNTHVFTTPFAWDGVQNILIDICSAIIPGDYTQNASVYYTVTPGVQTCLRYQSDTQVACGTSATGTLSSDRANMKITGEEMLNPPPQMPHSPFPANLAVSVPVNVTLGWEFGTNTTTYDLYLDTSYPPVIKVVNNQPAANPGSFNPGTLNFSTTYYWQVVAHNANGTTNGPIWNFYTEAGPQALPVFENFESGLVYFNNAPGNGVNWGINTSYYKSGVQSAHNPYDNTNQNVLHETGVLDLSSSAIVFLEFWHIAKTENNWDHCYVEISTNGGATYTILPQSTYLGTGLYNTPLYNNPAGPAFNEMSYPEWGGTSSIPPDNTWWQHETFDLSDYLTTNVRIRFRLHSDGSVLRYGWLIDDILIYEPAYGILGGTVTEASTGNPVQGAVVQVGVSASATTGSDGTYTLPGILTGSWTVTCSATGYNTQSATVVIVENQTTTQNFAMTAPNMIVNPMAVNEMLEMGETEDVLVNISNTGNGELNWNASLVILTSTSPDNTWDLQMSLDLQQATGALGNAGSECDGTYFYSTRWATNLIHRFDLSGNLIEEFSIPGVNGLRDLAFDGTHMFGGAAANTIYEMDFINKTLIGTISSPQQVRSIAYDEVSDAFWCANWATDITLVSKSGASLGSFPAAVHGLAGIYGTAYDNWTDGGPYLWIFDQGSGAGLPQLIYQANLGTTTMTGFSYNVLNDLGPNASAIAGGLFTVPNVFAGTVTIGGLLQGTPDVLFCYELAPYSTWISISPTSGTLAPATNLDMTVHLDATDIFMPGVYEAEIHFSSTPNVGTSVVNVTMTVGGLIPPVNLVVSHSCTDVNLVWQMPTGGNPDSWNVYRDGALIGNTTGMTYSDPMMMPQQQYCYHITAVYAGDESMPTQPGCITVPMPANLKPLNPAAQFQGGGNVLVTWTQPSACLAPIEYNVYRDGSLIGTTEDLEYLDEGLSQGFYEYYIKAVYYFGESENSNPAYVLVGINELSGEQFLLFPNPASSMVYIRSDQHVRSVEILNNAGQLVEVRNINAAQFEVNVSRLERGLYYFKLITEDGVTLRKVLVD